MNAEETLSNYVSQYFALSDKYGRGSECVEEQYLKLKDLVVVEIYFMRQIRAILSDDEMSGFIIYVDKYIRSVIDSYRNHNGRFLTYIRNIMELRAFNYIDDVIRPQYVADIYIRHYMPYTSSVVEADTCFLQYELQEPDDPDTRETLVKLKYFCVKRPRRRRSLFVFLCTQMTNLSVSTIDRFCEELNCDKDQTFAIADYLHEQEDCLKGQTREYMEQRRDYYWAKMLESETRRRTALNPELFDDALAHSRSRFLNRSESIRRINDHIPYNLVGEILNMDRVKVASEVYRAKEILEQINDDPEKLKDSPMRILAKVSSDDIQKTRIPRFEPFRVFGVKLLHYPTSRSNSMARGMDVSSESMDVLDC